MPIMKKQKSLGRGAGVLLPVASLPSPYGIGAFGKEAYQFVDFLQAAGQSYWQVLPLGPTSYGDSPYQSFSAFAGNPYFIDLDTLVQEGLLTREEAAAPDWGSNPADVDYAKIYQNRFAVLRRAAERSGFRQKEGYRRFCRENADWLEDYSFYMAVKMHFSAHEWLKWPEDIRTCQPKAVESYRFMLQEDIAFWKFCQYKFFEQWYKLKAYANARGIRIIGDIPIYVSLDSADVWRHPDLFQLDSQRRPTAVSGVPPDNFSATGQLWGNPLYRWDEMEKDGFAWWKKRMAFSAKLYDIVRVDHFIGIVRYYAIPYGETTAVNGEWRPGPGEALVSAIGGAMGDSQVIAEDLGCVVPEVEQLRDKAGYPGMKILEFAFDNGSKNTNLPCHYVKNCVVYGGTHDNETLVGFFSHMPRSVLHFACDYLHVKKAKHLPAACIRAAYESVADTAVIQLQDLLGLGNEARINYPSTIGTNWRWRLQKGQLSEALSTRMHDMSELYARLPQAPEKEEDEDKTKDKAQDETKKNAAAPEKKPAFCAADADTSVQS
ncbi:MAG: 4-alpha-glucanotransferase [Oscillospiraceae bacterium]|nr:4-alpha-glucanotransferase [Oscillospiraceae bacterium]